MALQLFPHTRRIAFVSSAETDLPEFHKQNLQGGGFFHEPVRVIQKNSWG